MKKLLRKFENLGQKAAQVQQVMSTVPGRVADIREAVAKTTGQLRQLRAELESGVADLRADNEQRLVQALMEINGSTDVFRQAGFDLAGVDMELAPAQRLIVHLRKIADVSRLTLRSLLAANQNRKTTHALLLALTQAEEVAGNIQIANLTYSEVIVHVGPIPVIRVCWQAEELVEEPSQPSEPADALSNAVPAPSPVSVFAQSTFFEPRLPQPLPAKTPAPEQSVSVSRPIPAPEHTGTQRLTGTPASAPVAVRPSDWKREALDRFKKMPDVSKYRRS